MVGSIPAATTECFYYYVGGSKMNVRERRQLGLTVASVLRAARRLAQENKLRGMSDDDLVNAVAMEWATTEARDTDHLSFDWQGIIDFINGLLPLIKTIMEIISIFSVG